MDAVRFGRALGFGARQAAKTMVSAVNAATAENPATQSAGAQSAPQSAPQPVAADRPQPGPLAETAHTIPAVQTVQTIQTLQPESAGIAARTVGAAARPAASATSATVTRAAAQGVAQAQGVRRGLGRFRESALEPVVRLSGVLWLEVMGVFFGIFALFAGSGAWRQRGEWRAALVHPGTHGSLIGAVAMCALFTYFCVSSFVRAKRRERRRG